MDIVKKNWLSIACGVVALIAVIAIFWPISGYYEELEADAKTRAANYSTLEGLANKSRTLPIVAPGEVAEPQPLNSFPTPEVIKWGQKLTGQVKSQSQELMKAVVELNRHQLLVPGSLPNPSSSIAFTFREEYNRRMNYDPATQDKGSSLASTVLRAGIPPTDLEIKEQLERERNAYLQDNQIFEGGKIANKDRIDQELARLSEALPQELFREAANRFQMYISPNAFTVHEPLIRDRSTPEPSTIFAAQMQLWIQEDICKAIRAMNGDSKNTMTSPVKHLLRIEVVLPPGMNLGTQQGSMAMMQQQQQQVAAAPADPGGELPKDFAFSPTGRTSNGLYDVIHSTVTIRTEADRIPSIVQGMQNNQFQTVIVVEKITPVDSSVEAARGYLYGEKPIVEVTMQVESLYLREWLVPLMPQRIKQAMGIGQPAAEAAAPTF